MIFNSLLNHQQSEITLLENHLLPGGGGGGTQYSS